MNPFFFRLCLLLITSSLVVASSSKSRDELTLDLTNNSVTNAISGATQITGDIGNATSTVINEITDAFEDAAQKLGAALLLIVGLVLLLLGYRLFRVTFFVAAFFFVGAICYFFLNKYQPGGLGIKGEILISAGVGIVAGLIAMFVIKIGFFLAGCVLGFFASTIAFTIVVPYNGGNVSLLMLINEPYQYYIAIILCSLFTGILALTQTLQKLVIIVGTSLAGSFSVMCFADYFAKTGFSETVENILVSVKDGDITSSLHIQKAAWGLIIGCLVLALIGVLLQYWVFGTKMCCAGRQNKDEHTNEYGYKI